jgi:hypothetical protein
MPSSSSADVVVGGLANAEASLFAVQRSNAELNVQRSVIQFRVNYLTQLNTQTTLLASAAIGMFSSIELEAITTQHESVKELPHTKWSDTFFCIIYICCSSISLGSSLWVLYTSNNLINLATSASLYARDLKDLQEADAVIGMRMTEVRQKYFHSLLSLIPAVLSMTMRLLPWFAWISASLVIATYLVNAIHEDYVSEHHLMETAFSHLPIHTLRPEWALERVAQSISRFVHRVAPWLDRYPILAWLVGATLGEGSLPRGKRRMSAEHTEDPKPTAAAPAPSHLSGKHPAGWMFKTASNKGPSALVSGLKLALPDGEPDTGAILRAILATPATTPLHRRWWTLEGKVLTCFASPEEASENSNVNERLVIDLSHYVVGRTVDAAGHFAIALIPYSLIGLDPRGRSKSSPWVSRRASSKGGVEGMETSRHGKESARYEGSSSHAGSVYVPAAGKGDQDRSWYLSEPAMLPCLPACALPPCVSIAPASPTSFSPASLFEPPTPPLQVFRWRPADHPRREALGHGGVVRATGARVHGGERGCRAAQAQGPRPHPQEHL